MFDNPAFKEVDEQRNFDNILFSDPDIGILNAEQVAEVSKYGWGRYSGKYFQALNKPSFLIAALCICSFSQGLVVTGITFTTITSIEKQFGLKSTESGLLLSVTYDAAYGICCLFVSYIGHNHKPRFIGLGMLVMACGCFIISIPEYLVGSYTAGIQISTDFCQISSNYTIPETNCNDGTLWYYKGLFALGFVLMGVGATPLYTLAPAHIEEVTHRGQGSLYLGIYYAAAVLGPAVGFIIGLPILNTWVDIKQPTNSAITTQDNNWVGAWWIGFLVGAGVLLFPVIPMLGFPRIFSDSKEIRKKKNELEDTTLEDQTLRHDLKSVWPSIKKLLQNKSFLFITLATASESLATGGFATFLPKFIETEFYLTASQSSLYTGIIIIPGAAGGIILGGYISKRFNWNCQSTLKYSAIIALVSTGLISSIFIGCEGREIVGVAIPYYNSDLVSLENNCNIDCNCNQQYYKPVCSVEDQQTFYSPCHAGCSKASFLNGIYYNCTCLPPDVIKVIENRCTPSCKLFPLFAVCAFLLMIFTFLNNVPVLNATFRVVPADLGSFAMGFQQVFARFLGFIPAPTIFGKLIDSSCKLWDIDECTEETTNCLEYDNTDFRFNLFLIGVVVKFLATFFIFLAFKFYRLPNKTKQITLKDVTNVAIIHSE
ncbi:solute carrier organic anion transporter family member 4C1 isoform X1 [Hydra vulgaris]|uniref:solute carrier organic anion transporter family member 4C1 isoform X1 n=1 Tax=Hydra vulgaris TaxID=6087 RepID=UPI0001923E4A|nr:solute carrier organic anion transporter family member 4C1-like [Hydra vulgaris]XP_012558739.1 solute carrier organic anion transporter family member 4C1-like [Hydra vulgaris]